MTGTYTTAELLPRMAQTVSECMGGAQVEVWLHDNRHMVREVCWPDDRKQAEPMPIGADEVAALPGDRVVPVRHHDEMLGMITVTKPAGEQVTPTEDKMLAAVASQAGLVLRNVRLLDDLRSSSERLVTTQDVERRRLERNLHDGAQQSLVSVALLLRMAAARVTDEQMRAALAEASAQLQQAIDELRELARGIHPAILTERGLGPALTSLAERSPVPVRLDVALPERPSATVEGTVYFMVAEALTNVAKYSGATTVTVTVAQDGDMVTAVVTDDGVGGADASRGSGLRGLADRVAAVDGTIDVHSPPGQGTTISCRLPAPAPRLAVLEPVS
jgi:signal transduction histidine kinase